MEEDSGNVADTAVEDHTETILDAASVSTKCESIAKPDNEQVRKDATGGTVESNNGSTDESGIATDATSSGEITVAPNKEPVLAVATVAEACLDTADLDSLPPGEELVLNGCAGSDSGVEGCGRALSSGAGSRSCASSVVSCGSGCGSESSSLAGAPHRPKRRVAVAEPPRSRGTPPLGASTPRITPRGPNLATRERARSREKPTPPEKPRPLTPKPRVRPLPELPALARESPALRVKPTRTSTARCRTPNSPVEEKRWPSSVAPRLSTSAEAAATRAAADKYGTLPRRRREGEADSSPRRGTSATREPPPPIARRPTVTRTPSSRATTKTRVRIYAEISSQTALRGDDVENALAGREVRTDILAVEKVHCGVQADRRQVEIERLEARLRRAIADMEGEKSRRELAEALVEEERSARRAAQEELQKNTRVLLELSGGAGSGGAGAAECLRALEEQLRAAADLAAAHRQEIDRLRDTCRALQTEASAHSSSARSLERRLAEAESEAAEMQDFLTMEKHSLQESLRDAEQELARTQHELTRRRAECRQLVRLCEQRRQEAMAASARARAGGGGAASGLDAFARRLQSLLDSLQSAYHIAREDLEDGVFYNEAFSRSDSGGGRTPDEPPSSCREPPARGSSLLAAVASAIRGAAHSFSEDRSEDNSADLLDSETEPCLVTDAAFEEGSTSPNPTFGLATDVSSIQVTESRRATRAEGSSLCVEGEIRRLVNEDSCNSLHNLAAWSADELSPVRDQDISAYDEASERESLQNLSAAIIQRQQSEAGLSGAEDADEICRARLLDKVVAVDNLLTDLLKVLRIVQLQNETTVRQFDAVREKLGDTEKNVAEVVIKKLAELDASRVMMEQYKQTIEDLTAQLQAAGETACTDTVEEELLSCDCSELRARYETLDSCLSALVARQRVVSAWPRLAAIHAGLEKLAFSLAVSLPNPAPQHTTHTIDSAA